MEDQIILEAYNKGWLDENSIYTKKIEAYEYIEPILQRAYDIGREHFILGDDFPKYDLLKDEEILKIIKKDES